MKTMCYHIPIKSESRIEKYKISRDNKISCGYNKYKWCLRIPQILLLLMFLCSCQKVERRVLNLTRAILIPLHFQMDIVWIV